MATVIKNNNPYTGPSLSLSNRVARAAWGIVWLFLFRTSPRPFHFWRRFLLRLFGAKIGKSFNIQSSAKIWLPSNLIAGNYIGVGSNVNLYNMGKIRIGDFSSISMGATLCAGTHDYNSPNHQLITKPILIGSHCWVCAEAFIHPGVSVPDGVVIGARSVVTKGPDRPWCVYSGFPAVIVKDRKIMEHRHE